MNPGTTPLPQSDEPIAHPAQSSVDPATLPEAEETPVTRILDKARRTHLERHRTYGTGDHARLGAMLAVIFPDGITLQTPDEFTRFHLFMMIVAKLNRYGANYALGGHADSGHDGGVYSFLLEAWDETHRTGDGG